MLDIGQGAVFYSTAKGRPALDFPPVGSPVSPFAAAVVKELGISGLEISDYFKVVSREVYKQTHGMELGPQQPFHYGSWLDDYYLVAPPEVSQMPAAMPPVSAPVPAPVSAAVATRGAKPVVDPLADISLDRLAIEDCSVAARAGFAGSRAILADAFAKGIGVAADPKEAAHWAKLARNLPKLRKDQRDLIAGIGE